MLRKILVASTFVSLLVFAGCRGPSLTGPSLSVNAPFAPSANHFDGDSSAAPAHEAPPRPIPEAYAHLPERRSFHAKDSVKLQPGFYRGDFSVGHATTVEGAGVDQTVIEGNLIFSKGQAEVRGVTVLGDVVFQGNQNELEKSDFRGAIHDEGTQNSY